MVIAIAGIVVAVLFGVGGILVGIRQTRIAEEQTRIANEMRAREEEREREETEWQRKQEAIANKLIKISPGFMYQEPGRGMYALYPDIFRDNQLRQAIQTYIVELVHNGLVFAARVPAPHMLRSENFRQTVTEATRQLAEYANAHPDIYAKMFGR